MMSATKPRVLALYKKMLREAQNFNSYNYRLYAKRRTKDAFRENKSETDAVKTETLLKLAQDNLQMMERQTTINRLFSKGKLVIE